MKAQNAQVQSEITSLHKQISKLTSALQQSHEKIEAQKKLGIKLIEDDRRKLDLRLTKEERIFVRCQKKKIENMENCHKRVMRALDKKLEEMKRANSDKRRDSEKSLEMYIEIWEKGIPELNAQHEEKMKKAKLEIGQQVLSMQELRRKLEMPVHFPEPEDKIPEDKIQNLEEELMLLRMKLKRRIPKYTQKEVSEVKIEVDMSSRRVEELANKVTLMKEKLEEERGDHLKSKKQRDLYQLNYSVLREEHEKLVEEDQKIETDMSNIEKKIIDQCGTKKYLAEKVKLLRRARDMKTYKKDHIQLVDLKKQLSDCADHVYDFNAFKTRLAKLFETYFSKDVAAHFMSYRNRDYLKKAHSVFKNVHEHNQREIQNLTRCTSRKMKRFMTVDLRESNELDQENRKLREKIESYGLPRAEV